jgi:biotin carboxylase
VLLLLPSGTYRAPDFVAAAQHLGVEVVVGSERRQAMAARMGDRALVVPMTDVAASVAAISALHDRRALDAVVAVDDQGVLVAASAAAHLGLPHNDVGAVGATRDKASMRERLAAAGVAQPAFRTVAAGTGAAAETAVAAAAAALGYPCVVKPVDRSGSQGVIRIDDRASACAAARRIMPIVDCAGGDVTLLVERFVPGAEVAAECLLRGGRLDVLAVFDKPDPLDGPFFEESVYVTPSSHPGPVLDGVARTAQRAAAALGLTEGPVHAELRIDGDGGCTVLELAARSIGGLCARALRFGAGISLEEVVLRHALGLGLDDLMREPDASGVLMLPITQAGVLDEVAGIEAARGVDGVVGVEITIASGRPVVPLPEGDRYLGFVFARGADPAAVVRSLRRAEAALEVRFR